MFSGPVMEYQPHHLQQITIFCNLTPPQLQKQSMLSQITVSSQVIHLYPPKLIFHFTSEHRHTEVVRTSLFIVTHLSVCRTVTCIAAQQRKNAFSLKTLMLMRCYYSSVPTTDFSLGQSQACLCLGFWYGKFKLMQGL